MQQFTTLRWEINLDLQKTLENSLSFNCVFIEMLCVSTAITHIIIYNMNLKHLFIIIIYNDTEFTSVQFDFCIGIEWKLIIGRLSH